MYIITKNHDSYTRYRYLLVALTIALITGAYVYRSHNQQIQCVLARN